MIIRLQGTYVTGQVLIDGKELNPERSLKVRSHSPDGFKWGYGGSGPTQLALAIMLEYCSSEQYAVGMTNKFKWAEIATLPMEDIDLEIDLTEYVVHS